MPSDILSPLFLTREQIERIHSDQIDLYGGLHGIRDNSLLESAIAMPEQSFGGMFLHTDLYEMAAAYAFHISENQPFIDGNKRTAFASSIFFLKWNAIDVAVDQSKYEALILQVSVREKSKPDIADFLRRGSS